MRRSTDKFIARGLPVERAPRVLCIGVEIPLQKRGDSSIMK